MPVECGEPWRDRARGPARKPDRLRDEYRARCPSIESGRPDRSAVEECSRDVGAVERRILELSASEIRLAEMRVVELGVVEHGAPHSGAFQMRSVEIRPLQACIVELHRTEIREA